MENTKSSSEQGCQFDAIVIKKSAVVLPNIILENRDSYKHQGWNNLPHRVYTYSDNLLKDSDSSYQSQFLLSLRLLIQQNCRWLLNHHLLSNVSHQNKPCISFYKILNKLENNVNHIIAFEATLRFEFAPKGYSFFCFYVKQVFHNILSVYYKYNEYNNQCQIIIL